MRLRAAKEDGSYADVELLRPAWWLEEQEAAVGRSIELSVPECGIDGQAEILAIAHCPPLAPPQPGYRTVTGTFKHYSAHVFDLAISGLNAPIGTTGNHPFYSLDREAFVRADELAVGERLQAASGAATVVALVERPLPFVVHNLEVQVDHVYHVSANGVLVHNGGLCELFDDVPLPRSYNATGLTPNYISSRLPIWREGDAAHGLLVVSGRGYLLRSTGRSINPHYASNLVPRGVEDFGIGFTSNNVSHVEAQAASLLRRLSASGIDVSKAQLHINRPYVCIQNGLGCAPNLEKMLPEGTVLEVFGSGAGRSGNANFLGYFRKFIGAQ